MDGIGVEPLDWPALSFSMHGWLYFSTCYTYTNLEKTVASAVVACGQMMD